MVLYYILLPLAWLVFHIGFRVHTVGRENLRKVQTKGCIIAPNHVSAIDPVFIVISRFWGRRMLVFAKKELFEINALLTWFFRCCGGVCVRGTKDEMAVISQTVEACKQGKTLLIFPEGTRNKTPDTFLPFHEGSFKIAEKANVPIIPMTIVNSAAVFEDHFPKIKKATVVIEYGKPIYPKELDKETRKSMGTYVQNIISETYFKNKELI